MRIIPAYAGSTVDFDLVDDLEEDHPRVCGEHLWVITLANFCRGSSPRMRGARVGAAVSRLVDGIIPAYAGSTRCPWDGWKRERDHPRVCGEHNTCRISAAASRGSSPRMRGARIVVFAALAGDGIIPAYAGSTSGLQSLPSRVGDHPRVCGEHVFSIFEIPRPSGSSPRMRGAHLTKCIASVIELVLHTVVKVQLTAHCYRFSYLQPYPQLRS